MLIEWHHFTETVASRKVSRQTDGVILWTEQPQPLLPCCSHNFVETMENEIVLRLYYRTLHFIVMEIPFTNSVFGLICLFYRFLQEPTNLQLPILLLAFSNIEL